MPIIHVMGTASYPFRVLPHLSLLWRFALVSFLVVAAIGVGLASVLGSAIHEEALEDAAADARDTLQARLLRQLSVADLEGPMTGERYAEFEAFVKESVLSARTARVKIWNREGTVIFSDEPSEVGEVHTLSPQLEGAIQGDTTARLVEEAYPKSGEGTDLGDLLEVYTPIVFPDSSEVVGAFEIHRFYGPVAARIADTQRDLYLWIGAGLALLYAALFAVVKRGSDLIRRQREDLERQAEELGQSKRETLLAISAALDVRDVETKDHSLRVQQTAVRLALEVGLPPRQVAVLEVAALLHDVGKIGVPDHILRKAGPLSEEEWAEMRRHPEVGYRLLRDFAHLRDAADIVYCHHERYDGTGYPRGLRGDDIPLAARIFAVADAYDAMTSERPYRAARSHKEALVEIRSLADTQFDPAVVEAFLLMMDRMGDMTAHPLQADLRPAA